jgi:hypothetical protein
MKGTSKEYLRGLPFYRCTLRVTASRLTEEFFGFGKLPFPVSH